MNFYMRVVCYRPVSLEQFFLKWLDWEKPYSLHDKLEEEYRKYIGWEGTELAQLTEDGLKEIWNWKSGGRWGKDRVICSEEQLKRFNEFREANGVDPRGFWEEIASEISKSGFIHQAFAFHIARPQDYPIVDRNVLRAHSCICGDTNTVVMDCPEAQPNCRSFDDFLDRYEPYCAFWFKMMEKLGLSRNDVVHNRKLDTAIRSFGKQLKRDYGTSNKFLLEAE